MKKDCSSSCKTKNDLKIVHNDPMAGHMLDRKTKALLKQHYTLAGYHPRYGRMVQVMPEMPESKKMPQQ